jgi:hypothetical protein
LTALESLGLWYNELDGTIPGDALAKLPSLWFLHVAANILSGSIPKELTKMTALKYLNLRSNRLNGTVPHLPFHQYDPDGSYGRSCGDNYDGLSSNFFACPLPPNATRVCGATCT